MGAGLCAAGACFAVGGVTPVFSVSRFFLTLVGLVVLLYGAALVSVEVHAFLRRGQHADDRRMAVPERLDPSLRWLAGRWVSAEAAGNTGSGRL